MPRVETPTVVITHHLKRRDQKIMATKKGSSKKGASKKGASRGIAAVGTRPAIGTQVGGIDRTSFDRATAEIAQAVRRAVASQPSLGKLKNPIIVGIWYNPKTKQVEVINQLEQG